MLLGLLILHRAGHICGLDGLVTKWLMVQRTTGLRWLTASGPTAQ